MERDTLPVDVVFVGAGPANLAAAYRLASLLEERGRAGEFEIMVVEKGREVGDHILSGAVMDPRGMEDVFGADWRDRGCPIEGNVTEEKVYTLDAQRARPLPFVPPPMHNGGFPIVTLSEVVRWMREQVEAKGVTIAEGLPAAELLFEDRAVKGVRLVDRGRERDGTPGGSFEPGAEIQAKITVLGEGSRGSLTKMLVQRLGLSGRNPQVYGTGIKEVWELPNGRLAPGTVYHTAGWPLANHQYGGSWIYALARNRASVGFVTGLDGRDPGLDPYEIFQTWKTHPFVANILEGGTLLKSGAKTVPEGGYWSRPQSHGAGFLILGDSGSLLNIARLKGIHTALKSGQLAGETIADALLEGNVSEASLARYSSALETSWVRDELHRVRNWRQIFARHGFRSGKIWAGLAWALGGRLFSDPVAIHEDHAAMEKGQASAQRTFQPDGKLTFDKLTGVFHAGTMHEEHQPSHLLVKDTNVCATRCREEFGNPCERFCPAAVYEMVDDGSGGRRLQINASNCVHCKTCDIADPYGIIDWTVPQDNGGPRYLGL